MVVSFVVLFGIFLVFFITKDGLGKLHAFVAVMFGLFLGTTDVGPKIMQGFTDLLNWANSSF
ncbi:hypothetical protein SEA_SPARKLEGODDESS_205 [Streptomyces phage SparkleGoddess]|uniref:Uncharacterized protein n=1 Tax=Streptomyces phage SparkleGoddess TaxID=2283305 RepID=A0A345MEA3_9CAUD|nr:hypothetical protein SEA_SPARKLEGODDESS_205 [Streptomyces phage SparkleGoddess]UTN92428.1 hypothetical protein SEA_STIGMA_204 [Streptomyces phage Stigma]